MASRDVVVLNETVSRLEVAQAGDTYNFPRSVMVAGDSSSTGAVNAQKVNVGGNTASVPGRIKVNAVEFADGTVASTGTVVTGSQNIDSVLGLGNTTTKGMVAGRFGVAATDFALPIPAANIVDHDFFDNTQDSAWIDRCADKSWELEIAKSRVVKSTAGATYATALAAVNAESMAVGEYYISSATGADNNTLQEITSITGTVPAATAAVSQQDSNAALGRSLGSYTNAAAAIAAGGVVGDYFYSTTSAAFERIQSSTTSVKTTRAGSRKFPMRGLVTAESARVIIWDITSGSPEMWMVFNRTNTEVFSSITMVNEWLCIGVSSGTYAVGYVLPIINFVSEMFYVLSTGSNGVDSSGLVNRNAPTFSTNARFGTIVNITVNSVAITYLPDAPLDGYGMRVPTIAVGTAGGVSVIKDDGSVVNLTGAAIHEVQLSSAGRLWAFDGGATLKILNFGSLPTVTQAVSAWRDGFYSHNNYTASLYFPGSEVATWYNTIPNAISTGNAVVLFRENPTTPANGMVAYLTNTYNTGWMVGDIRRCFLTNSADGTTIFTGGTGGAITNGITFFDASVKTGVLTATSNGGLTVSQQGGMKVYSGFDANNYFSEATSPDFANIGTGDFFLCAWVKGTFTGQHKCVGISNAAFATATVFALDVSAGNNVSPRIGNSGVDSQLTIADNQWQMIAMWRKSSVLYMAANGVVDVNTLAATADVSPILNVNTLRIGIAQNGSGLFPGQIALVRLSATAPTAEQIKHMYETERKLFEPNAQALLSNSASVTDLRYDKKSGMYAATNGTNTDLFKDLVRVDSAATSATIATPVTTLSGNRVLAPAVDIGSELAAQVKPDKHSIIKAIAAVGGVVSLPMGYKPLGCYDVTGAALVRLTTANTAFDGFIHSVTGLTGTQTYDITMEAV